MDLISIYQSHFFIFKVQNKLADLEANLPQVYQTHQTMELSHILKNRSHQLWTSVVNTFNFVL